MVQTICGTCVAEWCAFHGKPGNGCMGYQAPSPPTTYTNKTKSDSIYYVAESK